MILARLIRYFYIKTESAINILYSYFFCMSDFANFIPAITISLREWLEVWLVIMIMMQYITTTQATYLIPNVWIWFAWGVLISLWCAYMLSHVYQMADTGLYSAWWESIMSLIAVWCIVWMIVWMIKSGSKIHHHIRLQTSQNFHAYGIMLITVVFCAREWLEITLFALVGQYHRWGVVIGLLMALMIVWMISHGLYRINLSILFHTTLIYLILQAWYLSWYTIHEWLDVVQNLWWLTTDSLWSKWLFDLSSTIWNHKNGWLWLPLHILVWRYSKPELIQFVTQYSITLLLLWYRYSMHKSKD